MTVNPLRLNRTAKWTLHSAVLGRRNPPRLLARPQFQRQTPHRTRAPPRLKATMMEFDSVESWSLTTTPAKLKVAVDVDEVLGQFLVALNLFCEKRYGMRLEVDDYHVYHFATVWGCSQQQSNQIVHEFFKSPHFHQLPLVPGALEALCEMQEWCELHVVTSRQHVIREITIEWLTEHYPGIFTSVHFGNHFAMEGEVKRKSELCREIEADVLIDDNPDYALDCASSGMHAILYNWRKSYPWSTLGDRYYHSRIQEVQCWSMIPSTLKELHTNMRS